MVWERRLFVGSSGVVGQDQPLTTSGVHTVSERGMVSCLRAFVYGPDTYWIARRSANTCLLAGLHGSPQLNVGGCDVYVEVAHREQSFHTGPNIDIGIIPFRLESPGLFC